MKELLIAYDTDDDKLGSFFRHCKDCIEPYLEKVEVNYQSAIGEQLNEALIEWYVQEKKSFIFSSFSHGDSQNLLWKNSTPYISMAINGDKFTGSFIYAFACNSGETLGQNLVENGCKCYIGYSKSVSIWSTELTAFAHCAIIGFVQFLNGSVNSQQMLDSIKQEYTGYIDKVYTKNYVVAAIMRENRSSIVLHGDSNVTIADF